MSQSTRAAQARAVLLQRLPQSLRVFGSLSRTGLTALLLCSALGITLSVASSAYLQQQNRALAEQRFLALCERLSERLRQRLRDPEHTLLGARGALAAAAQTDRQSFRRYVQSHDLLCELPHARALGFVRRVARADEDAFLAQVRSEQEPTFGIHELRPHAGPRFIVQYLEPHESERAAVGLDLASEPRRREAALHAARTAQPTLTPPITLAHARSLAPGFLLFLPVYRPGAPTATPTEREAALLGWVHAVLEIDPILADLRAIAEDQLDFALLDLGGPAPQAPTAPQALTPPQALLYASSPYGSESEWRHRHSDPLSHRNVVEVGGRRWLVVAHALPAFRAQLRLIPAALLLCAGLLATLLLAVALGAGLGAGRRARSLAAQKTAAIKEQEQEQEQERKQEQEQEQEQRSAEAREQADAADAASRAKSEFLANMSHELRTPLNAVLGFTELLLDGSLSALQQQHVRAIRSAGESLLGQVDAILAQARLAAGQLVLRRQAVALRELLSGALDKVREPAAQRGLRLSYSVAPRCPERIVTDPERLQQALGHLLQNAVKFTERGEVQLRAQLAGELAAPSLRIEVEDTGIGISSEALPRLFLPFSQGDASTTRCHGGTGLGLSLSRHLIEELGGQVGVASEPGQGSTFWLQLPLRDTPSETELAPTPQPGAPPRKALRPGQPPRILVAEDNPANQAVAARLLAKLGCEVDVAADGREAIEAARARTYDLIFMDCQMPEVDGYEATARIRGLAGPSGQVAIVALTADTQDTNRARCRAAGMSDFIGKPVNRAALVRALESWLPQPPQPPLAALPESDLPGLQATLEEQRSLLGPDVVRELAGLFCAEAAHKPAELRAALARGDLTGLRGTAHKLRGSALQLGAQRTAELCARLESLALCGADPLQLGGVLDGLQDSLARCSTYLLGRV
ncbi:MAG: CHASE domain-containing protein [Polyangia bacterium]